MREERAQKKENTERIVVYKCMEIIPAIPCLWPPPRDGGCARAAREPPPANRPRTAREPLANRRRGTRAGTPGGEAAASPVTDPECRTPTTGEKHKDKEEMWPSRFRVSRYTDHYVSSQHDYILENLFFPETCPSSSYTGTVLYRRETFN